MYPFYSCQCLHIGLKIFSIKQNSDKSKESWCTSKKKTKKNKDQFSIKTSGIEILLNKGTQQDKHLVNCSSPFKYTCYVKVQILTVKFGKSVIFWVKVFQISLCHTKMVSITNISNHNKYRNQRQKFWKFRDECNRRRQGDMRNLPTGLTGAVCVCNSANNNNYSIAVSSAVLCCPYLLPFALHLTWV